MKTLSQLTVLGCVNNKELAVDIRVTAAGRLAASGVNTVNLVRQRALNVRQPQPVDILRSSRRRIADTTGPNDKVANTGGEIKLGRDSLARDGVDDKVVVGEDVELEGRFIICPAVETVRVVQGSDDVVLNCGKLVQEDDTRGVH